MRHRKRLCVLGMIAAKMALAAAQKTSGVEGVVTIDGTAFAGVEVEASSASQGVFWETTTNSSGYYLLGDVRPGKYTMWAEMNGHGCIVIPRVLVKDGQHARQDFHFSKGKTYPGCESVKAKKHG
jgi:Carboxypeptidase regulatory-like domain